MTTFEISLSKVLKIRHPAVNMRLAVFRCMCQSLRLSKGTRVLKLGIMIVMIIVEDTGNDGNDYLQQLLVLLLQSEITKRHIFSASSTCQKTLPKNRLWQYAPQFCICLLQPCTNFPLEVCILWCWEQAACWPVSFSCVIPPMFCHSCRLCCVFSSHFVRHANWHVQSLSKTSLSSLRTPQQYNGTITKTYYVIIKTIPSLKLSSSPLKIGRAPIGK